MKKNIILFIFFIIVGTLSRIEAQETTPWIEDVEAGSQTGSFDNYLGWSTNYEPDNDDYNWGIREYDDYYVNSSGPAEAHSGTNYFVVGRGNNIPSGLVAELYSPFLDISSLSSTSVQFYYYMFGDGVGEIHVDIHDGNNWNNNISVIIGEQQEQSYDPWLKQIIDITEYTNSDIIQVRFRAINSGSSNSMIALDDIEVKESPECLFPLNLNVDSVTNQSAILTWEEIDAVNSWEIELVPTGFNPIGVPSYSGVNSPFSIDQLPSCTSYDIYVRSSCDEELYSEWSNPVTFNTSGVITDIYFENFDNCNVGDLPACWNKIINSESPYSRAGANDYKGITEPFSLEMASYEDGSEVLAISPELTGFTTGTHQLRFQARTANNPTNLKVGVMSDPTDASTFTLIEDISIIGWDEPYEEYIVEITGISGEYNYFALKVEDDYNVMIDNLYWEPITSCDRPTSIMASNVTMNSASLSWVNTFEENLTWDVVIVPKGTPLPAAPTASEIEMPYEPTQLNPGTEYDFYVRTNCSDENTSSYSGPYTFSTSCQAYGYFKEDFEGSNKLPECWRTILSYESDVRINSENNNLLELYSGYWGNDPVYAITPSLSNLSAGNYQIRFEVIGDDSFNNDLEIGTMSNPYDVSTYNVVQDIDFSSYDLEEFTVAFTQETSDEYVVFKGIFNDAQSIDDIRIDNIVWEPITNCDKPSELGIEATTTETATLSWLDNAGASLWDIEIVETGEEPTGLPTNSLVSNPYTVTGLDPSTTYEYYVRAHCTEGGISSYTGPFSFTTRCLPIEGSFFESFDYDYKYPDCWSKITPGGTYVRIGTYDSFSSPHHLLLEKGNEPVDIFAITPSLSELPSGTYQIRFQLKIDDPGAILELGTMSDDTAPNTFSLVEIIENTSGYQEFTIPFEGTTDTYIAFKGVFNSFSYDEISIDNVYWEPVPTCLPVTNLTGTSLSATQVELNWEPIANASQGYQWFAFPNGADPEVDSPIDSGITSNGITTANIEGLSPSVNYDFYVKTDCGSEDGLSVFTSINLTTPPANDNLSEAILLNLGESCSGDLYSNFGATSEFGEPTQLDNCTQSPNSTSNSVWFKFLAPESGEVKITTDILPGSIGDTEIAVYAAPTDLNNLNTLGNELDCNQNGGSIVGWGAMSELELNALVPENEYYVKVDGFGDATGTFCIEVYDLSPPCMPVTNINIIEISYDSLEISWDPGSTETDWTLFYGIPGFDPETDGQQFNVEGITNTGLNMLTPNTTYELYIRSNCINNEFIFADSIEFTTLSVPCEVPTGVSLDEIIEGSSMETCQAVISWTENNSALQWEIVYGPLNFDPDTEGVSITSDNENSTIILNNLSLDSSYEVYVRSLCLDGQVSEFSEVLMITTPELSISSAYFENLNYFPNPVINQINFTSDFVIDKISIFDLKGKNILKRNFNTSQPRLVLSNLQSGIYFMSIEIENKVKIFKFIKK